MNALVTLDGFVFERVLKDSPDTKMITVLGTYNGQQAIATLQRSPFNPADAAGLLTDATILKEKVGFWYSSDRTVLQVDVLETDLMLSDRRVPCIARCSCESHVIYLHLPGVFSISFIT